MAVRIVVVVLLLLLLSLLRSSDCYVWTAAPSTASAPDGADVNESHRTPSTFASVSALVLIRSTSLLLVSRPCLLRSLY